MKITEIRIHLVKIPKSKILGNASVTFEETLVVHDFKIVESPRGPFVGLPTKQIKETYKEMVQFLKGDIKDEVCQAILRAYQDEIAKPEHRFLKEKA